MKNKQVDLNRSLRAKFKGLNNVEVVVVDHNSGTTYVWTLTYNIEENPNKSLVITKDEAEADTLEEDFKVESVVSDSSVDDEATEEDGGESDD